LTPSARTSVERPSVCDTRFCTSTAAMSELRVTSNVTVICDTPEFVLDDVM
jgi:hypothetical protein